MGYFQIGEALTLSWGKFKEHFVFLWVTLGVTIALSALMGAVEKVVGEGSVSFLVSIVSTFLTMTVQLGLTRLYLDLIDSNTEGKVGALFSQYRLFFRYVGAAILFGLMVFFGVLLFIVPGIYLALKYQFFSELIVDKQLGIMESLRKSGEITEGIKWQLLGFSLVLAGVNVLGALCFGLGLLVTIPVTTVAYFIVYRKLSLRLGQNIKETPTPSVSVEPNTSAASL